MSTRVESPPRWRLPVRRKRFLLIAVPTILIGVSFVFTALGHWRTGIGLALMGAGITWQFGVMVVRFADTPGPPDPRMLRPTSSERKHMLHLVRRRIVVARGEAARLQPLVEQTGRTAARGLLTGMATTLTFGGILLGRTQDWGSLYFGAIFVMFPILTVLAWRDRRACAKFLDRY